MTTYLSASYSTRHTTSQLATIRWIQNWVLLYKLYSNFVLIMLLCVCVCVCWTCFRYMSMRVCVECKIGCYFINYIRKSSQQLFPLKRKGGTDTSFLSRPILIYRSKFLHGNYISVQIHGITLFQFSIQIIYLVSIQRQSHELKLITSTAAYSFSKFSLIFSKLKVEAIEHACL